jgi:hypothetical protein
MISLTNGSHLNLKNKHTAYYLIFAETLSPLNRIRILIVFIFVALSNSGFAQSPCYSVNNPVLIGEQIDYRIAYNFGALWIDAGWVRTKTSDTLIDEKPFYYFFGTGASSKHWDWLYRVWDTIDVITETEQLQPLTYRRHSNINGYQRYHSYQFDHDKKIVHAAISETDIPYEELSIPLPSCTYDALTASYVARSIDFENAAIGETMLIKIIIDDKVYEMPIVYEGMETISSRNKTEHYCYLFTTTLQRGHILKHGEKLKIWVSSNPGQIPIMMEAKIRIGSIKIYLDS